MARMPLNSIFFIIVILTLSACGSTQNMTMSTDFPKLNEARDNAQLALGYLHQGYTDLALEKIQLAMQQAPHDTLVIDTAAYYYEKTGEIDKANQYFAGALLLNPHSNVARNNYGAFLCRNGMDTSALWYFRATEQQPSATTRLARANRAYCSQKTQFMLGDNQIYAYHMSQRSNLNGR